MFSLDPKDREDELNQYLQEAGLPARASSVVEDKPALGAEPDLGSDDGLDSWLDNKAEASRADLAPPPRAEASSYSAPVAAPKTTAPKPSAAKDYGDPSPFSVWLSAIGASLGGKSFDDDGFFAKKQERADSLRQHDKDNARADAIMAKQDAEAMRLEHKGDAEKQRKIQLAADNANADSTASVRRRQSVAPLLKQFGMNDDEISRLTADDLDAASTGDLVKGIGELRRKAQERADSLVDEERKRTAHLEDEKTLIAERAKYKHGTGGGGYTSPTSFASEVDLLKSQIPEKVPADRRQVIETAINAAAAERNPKVRDKLLASAQHNIDAARQEFGANKEVKDPTAITSEDYMGVPGFYVQPGHDQAFANAVANKRIDVDVYKSMKTANAAISNVDNMIELRKKHGGYIPETTSPGDHKAFEGFRGALKGNYREVNGMPSTDSSTKEVEGLVPDNDTALRTMVGGKDPVIQQLYGLRREIIDSVNKRAQAHHGGFDPDRKARAGMQAPPTMPARQADKVKMKFPDGKTRLVPTAQAAAYQEKFGGQVVQ